MPKTTLDAILRATRQRIAGLRGDARQLARRAAAPPEPRPFARALAARAGAAASLGLAVVAEIHAAAELAPALAVGPAALGVNSRDLGTFTLDLALAERLVASVPGGVPVIAESGIETRGDVERMAAAGADLVLVGTAVARPGDPAAAVAAVVGVARTSRPCGGRR